MKLYALCPLEGGSSTTETCHWTDYICRSKAYEREFSHLIHVSFFRKNSLLSLLTALKLLSVVVQFKVLSRRLPRASEEKPR
jgi:hypothetical protein